MTALDPAFLHLPLAHRGLHDRRAGQIENTISAFRAAIEAGYGIELDLQLSSDGEAMVFHDYTLDRLTDESGPVAQRTAAELKAITLKDSADRIPTLADVLTLVRGRVPLLIEIKDQSRDYSTTNIGPLEQAAATALRFYDGPLAVMSFNPVSVAAFTALAPDIAIGLTTEAFTTEVETIPKARLTDLRSISAFDPLSASFISHDRRDLTAPAVTALKARGVPILCWTVRSAVEEAEARKVADNITFEGYAAAVSPS